MGEHKVNLTSSSEILSSISDSTQALQIKLLTQELKAVVQQSEGMHRALLRGEVVEVTSATGSTVRCAGLSVSGTLEGLAEMRVTLGSAVRRDTFTNVEVVAVYGDFAWVMAGGEQPMTIPLASLRLEPEAKAC